MCNYFGLDLELQFGEIWTSIVKRPYIAIGMELADVSYVVCGAAAGARRALAARASGDARPLEIPQPSTRTM